MKTFKRDYVYLNRLDDALFVMRQLAPRIATVSRTRRAWLNANGQGAGWSRPGVALLAHTQRKPEERRQSVHRWVVRARAARRCRYFALRGSAKVSEQDSEGTYPRPRRVSWITSACAWPAADGTLPACFAMCKVKCKVRP